MSEAATPPTTFKTTGILVTIKKMLPFVPYGVIALTAVYMMVCFLVTYLVSPCEHVQNQDCGYEGMDNTTVAYATDFFITIFMASLALHLYLQTTRKILITLVFATLSFGYMCKGLVVRYFGDNGLDDGSGMKGYFFLTMIQYLCWATSTLFIGFLVHAVWKLLEENARFCGSIESKFAIIVNVLSALVIATGCFWSGIARWDLTDHVVDDHNAEEPSEKQSNLSLQLLRVGQLAWHGSYCMVLIATAYVLGALGKQRPSKFAGLPNYGAAAGIVMAQVALAGFVIYYALPDGSGTSKGWAVTKGSSVPTAFIDYFMLLSTFFLHNLFLVSFQRVSEPKKAEKTNDVEEDTDEMDSFDDDIEDHFFDSQRKHDDVSTTIAQDACTGTNWLFFLFPMLRRESYAMMEEEPEEQEMSDELKGPGGAKITIRNEMSFYDVEKQKSVDQIETLQFSPDQLQVAVESSEEEDAEQGPVDVEKVPVDADLWNGAQQCVEMPLDDPEIPNNISEHASASICEELNAVQREEEIQNEETHVPETTNALDKDDDNSNRSAVRKIFAALGLSRSRSKQELREEENPLQGENQQLPPSFSGVEFWHESSALNATVEKVASKSLPEILEVSPTFSSRNAEPAYDNIYNATEERDDEAENFESYEVDHHTSIFRIDVLEPELMQRVECDSPQFSENQKPSMLKSFMRRQKKKACKEENYVSRSGSKRDPVKGVSSLVKNVPSVGTSVEKLEDTASSMTGITVAASRSEILCDAREEVEMSFEQSQKLTFEETQEVFGEEILQQESCTQEAVDDPLTKQKSGSRHRRALSLSLSRIQSDSYCETKPIPRCCHRRARRLQLAYTRHRCQ